MECFKKSFKLLLFILVATLVIWPCIGYIYDPKGEFIG